MAVTVKADAADNLPAIEAQEWAEEKHRYLRRYLGISSEARRKFRGAATYSELFCGPGRLYLKGTERFFDGSPLVAWKESKRTSTPFSAMHLCDEREEFCQAVGQRLKAFGAQVETHALKSEAAAKRVVARLPSTALNVAFLDPFNLGDLPFTIIEEFAKLIKGPKNQPLYWLVLVAKHPLATKFWDEVNKPDQGDLGL